MKCCISSSFLCLCFPLTACLLACQGRYTIVKCLPNTALQEEHDIIAGYSPLDTLPTAVLRGWLSCQPSAAPSSPQATSQLDLISQPQSATLPSSQTPQLAPACHLASTPQLALIPQPASTLHLASSPHLPPTTQLEHLASVPQFEPATQLIRTPAVAWRWPHMLITASLHDERVPFWGPAKWVTVHNIPLIGVPWFQQQTQIIKDRASLVLHQPIPRPTQNIIQCSTKLKEAWNAS